MKKITLFFRHCADALNRWYKSFRRPETAERDNNSRQREKPSDCLVQMEEFLNRHYAFRFNQLTEQTEYRETSDPKNTFRSLGKRDQNTICMAVCHAGINCWDRDVARYVNSRNMEEYHPFRLFIDALPAWDGMDRLEMLALRVSGNPVWVRGFRRWLLALMAQWMGTNNAHANSVAPVLVSSVQGIGKSTFWKSLLPPQLQEYYSDSYDPSNPSQAEQKLARFGLINLDEMDKYSPTRMATLKNLMQMASLNIKKAYQKNYVALPRIASFAATSNYKELLTDPTGSRRFLCVETNKIIDCTGIDHAQVYAQLKQLILGGKRYWFSKEEEHEIQQNNAAFYRPSPGEEVFRTCFRAAYLNETCKELTGMEIFHLMKQRNPSALQGFSPRAFGKMLSSIGVEHVHTRMGNRYKVVGI